MTQIKRSVVRTVLCLAAFVMVAGVANACGCYPFTTVLDDYEDANLVIVARFVSVTKTTTPRWPDTDIGTATMIVERVYKGDVKVGDKLVFAQGNFTLDCSWTFYEKEIGEQYLLYLYRPSDSTELLKVPSCHRSKSVEYANEDFLYLDNIDKRRGRTRVSGVLEGDGIDESNVADRKIFLRGENKTYFAVTNKNGVYEIYDLPPGRYILEPELKSGWKVDRFELTRVPGRSEPKPSNRVAFTLRAKKHFGANINLALNNHISGIVRDGNLRPMRRVCVRLAEAEKEQDTSCSDFTETDGSFRVDGVEAGTYVLVLNPEDKPTAEMPFRRLYFGNTAEHKNATRITVNHGESIDNLNVVISNLIKGTRIDGVVRYADGRPAGGGFVNFKPQNTDDKQAELHNYADDKGRFSFTVLGEAKGEVFGSYRPGDRQFATCPSFMKLIKKTGRQLELIETQHVEVDGTKDLSGLVLRYPVTPCTQ